MCKVQNIKKSLVNDGYFMCNYGKNFKYNDILNLMGEIILVSDIKFNPESKRYIHGINKLPLHTDSPEANIIAWQCISQDKMSGDSIIFDSRKIINQLNKREIQNLSSTFLPYPSINGGGEKYHPVITKDENQYKLYYTPWYDGDKKTKELNTLKKLIRQHSSLSRRIMLKPNQMLIIDNQRMLHGRDALSKATSRHLKRFWLTRK